LWPTNEAGVYEATIRLPRRGPYDLRVTVAGITTDTMFVVTDDAAHASPDDRDVLTAIATVTGGRTTDLTDVAPIIQHLRQAERPRAAVAVRPMRSPWWILPFTFALCGEWALRRRRGLR
jgi:hypothetical protein